MTTASTGVGFVVALLSLACCSTTVAGQFSASFWETWGHYMQLASTKPIDWNDTIGLRDSGQVQESCYDQSVQLHTDMTTGQSYAIQMLDSSGKLNPTALFEGRYDDFGSFKGCRDRVKYAPDIPADMKAMYCVLGWTGIAPELTGGAQSFTQGLCVPNTCGDLEVALLANTGLLGTKPMPSWTVVGILCHREEVYASFDTGAYVALSFIAIILLMLLIGTLFEFIINVSYTEEKVKSITKSKTGRFFLSFSVYSNTKKVFNTYQPAGQLPALHGIRVISTLWIIYGHTDFFADNTLTTNKRQKDEWFSQWWYFIRGSMDMAVDTFLLLSALLVSYLFMKQLKKNGGSFTGKDLLLHYLHRYWRLTPVYAFLIMIFACLMVYMGTGPVWASPINLATGNMKACQTWMWTNLLYINNWFNGEQECFGWSWYLGVDMQLYVIAPGLLVLLYKKPKLGVGLVTFFLILSMFLTGILYHLFVNVPSGSYYATVYKFTFTRMGPYMVGLLMGYILFTTDRKVPNTGSTKALMLLGWFGATAVAVLFVGAPGWIGTPFSIWGQPAWRAFDRTMFSCAVAWVVFACCVGYGGIITEFLSWSGWVPLSRLTYTAYLVHPIIMHVYTMSLKTPLFYSATNWWFYFIAYSFMAFLCGFVASIMVEFPFFGLEKLIFPQRRGRDSSKASNNVTSGAHDNQALELGETRQPVDDRAAKSNGQMAITNDENDKIPGQANGQWSVSISANQETFDQKL
ncbi:nose resistant to fluoxetine protein 6-like [Branchiostoma floridae]|uniref:Nose resistant to fluoxetine protein 6-like n=1 Tax=Branchiostoma floridae TaxID=7739 RepID=A0A9J7MAC5_BRAFL|nr:nose resistant to fluoxetine protein 6-like [Branchiostoma floridae]